ncbi:E3 ubiquitin-protein ligase TRIM21-like [Cololabis saira]|uniref:E3 ubiquitin-protein ligase TRIM21-like n=1 Tax=Cololabis saira TaxID=129043 RepID=UPI002AD430B5|nr:E3 ubiquitin-protein ligase TRIM21-like [Cololabis saira]
MASATSLTDDHLLCAICLSAFNKPASIPCGHTFCLQCIEKHWVHGGVLFNCPLCKEEFSPKPMLRVNIVIAEMEEKFKNMFENKSGNATEETGNGEVLCDRCTEPKSAALKSCLVCLMSFCETHLEPHQNKSALKKHKLILPVKNLESRLCKDHDEPLELFCRDDQMFLCQSCKQNDHKCHMVVTLEEEAQLRRAQLAEEKEGTDQMIHARQQKFHEIQSSLEENRKYVEEALSCSSRVMTAMGDFIKRSQIELAEVIKAKQNEIEKQAIDFINEMDEEMIQIKKKELQLNEVSPTDDHLTFLENVISLTITSPQVKDWSDVSLKSDQLGIREAVAELETTITTEISRLCDPTFKEKQKYAVDVTLDPDTANPSLNVSEDGKQVMHRDRKRSVQINPERFDHVLNVLAKEGFCSGKFYYEVQVKDKTQWNLGVASSSINRKGDIRLSPRNGYWTICMRKGGEFIANAFPPENLQVRKSPQKVGVFVDYEEGQVSFYDVDARAIIFCFSGCTFTENLFPFFSPAANDGGTNSAPLIITPVTYNR